MAGTNFIQSLHHLKIAKEFFQDLQRQNPGTKGSALAKLYENKIEWIYKDLITNPNFDATVVDGIKAEWASDAFIVPALHEKIATLRPDQRENLEMVVDLILKGETIDISLTA